MFKDELDINKRIVISFLIFSSLMVIIYGSIYPIVSLAYIAVLSVSLFFSYVITVNRFSLEEIMIYIVFPFLLISQIYVPVLGTIEITIGYFYLFLFFILILGNHKFFKWIGNQKLLSFYLIFLLTLFIAIIYSPDKFNGIRTILFLSTGLFSLLFGFYVKEKNYNIEIILKYLIFFGVPLAFFNILFFLYPDLEAAYLHSKIATILIEPGDVEGLYGERRNNIVDPLKSGTVFTDTNDAAIFFQMLFWVSITLLLKNKRKINIISALFFFLAFLTTYSRGGLAVFGITFLLIIFLNIRLKSLLRIIFILIFSFATTYLIISSDLFVSMQERLTLNALINDPRFLIWRFAYISFIENPFLGLGFGGWEATFPFFANSFSTLNTNYPPHNIFIQVWVWGGVLSFISFLILLGYSLVVSILKYRKKEELVLVSIASISIVIFQGFVQNFFLVDFRISCLFFFIIGLCLYNSAVIKTDKL
ncbi:O-antigen ligase [Planomicrobium sp. CPCC 101079]|uniref:O-antigen ligase family protein n=1 Tax=Planomicrobium sp. CPCC 101079 TaxID=2599618 RepID=UPI0011B7FD66|nr:O-antigen ligase family protein [Planomicrobium sp. CPCC 101079]TWT03601.1 O-antigen ligase family protein [Planomicrobium sp. CPCC 101079]